MHSLILHIYIMQICAKCRYVDHSREYRDLAHIIKKKSLKNGITFELL